MDDDRQVRIDILRPSSRRTVLLPVGLSIALARWAQVRHSNIAQVLHVGKAAAGLMPETAVDGYSLSHRLGQLAQRELAS